MIGLGRMFPISVETLCQYLYKTKIGNARNHKCKATMSRNVKDLLNDKPEPKFASDRKLNLPCS